NNWGKGLPMSTDNSGNYPIFEPLLANPDLDPSQNDILRAVEHFQEILQIRYSSPLFRLQTAEQIQSMLTFLNTGPDQIPAVIVSCLSDVEALDAEFDQILVVFNATPGTVTFSDEIFADHSFARHPVFASSGDEIVQKSAFNDEDTTFSVPALT